MPPRAFIIAIEEYPQAVGLATELKGTYSAANDFWNWFVEKKLKPLNPPVDPKDVVIGCVNQDFDWRTTGTTRQEILDQLDTLVSKGQDDTSELYFFFSGHGFSYTDMGWTRAIDVLVCSEFKTTKKSGGACIKLQEIQEKLWSALGPGDHYYFIDACRNTTTHADINVLDTGMTFTPSQLGKPFRYTLYSTVKGTAAEVESGFSPALVAGLKGSGHAKGWDQSSLNMYVKFDLLVDYVAKKLPGQAVDPNVDGNGDGLILQLVPIPESDCHIAISNASATDKFKLVAKTIFGQQPPIEFEGNTYSFKLPPFFYNIELTHSSSSVVRIKPAPPNMIDLFDTCEVQYELKPLTLGGGAPPAPPKPQASILDFTAPMAPDSEIEVINVLAGTTMRGADLPVPKSLAKAARPPRPSKRPAPPKGLQGEVEPGTYMLRLRERGVVVGRQKVTVAAGEKVKIDLLDRPDSKTREDILKAIANEPTAKIAILPALGPTANMDPSLWLSLFGCGRIMGSDVKKELDRFETLNLEGFDDIKAGSSCVYVLAAFEKSQGKFGIGVSNSKEVNWKQMKSVPQLTSVYQWRQKSEPGPCLLSMQLPEQVPITFATYCLPNRATFMVVAEDEVGRLAVRHYMLPIGKLIGQLDPLVRERIESDPLNIVRYMSLVQGQFARKRALEPAGKESDTWMELVYGKWVDPVMSLIAAYYLIRHGNAGPNANESDKSILNTITGNLRQYFGDLPDIAAIERMMGKKVKLPSATPIILDGVMSFEADIGKVLTLPQNKLEYGGPWTTWRGAVDSFVPSKAKN